MSPGLSPNEFIALTIVHISGVLILLSFTFLAFAAPPSARKKILAGAGIGSLLVLLTGLRMWQGVFNFTLAGWIIVKIVCWLGVSAFAGLGFRRREKAAVFGFLALALAILAVIMVVTKPF